MEYILINLLTISLFTYIVHIVANRVFAIHMHIKFPILCACCALLINLILPRIFIEIAGLTGTLGIVILFAIISSYCIASYYDDTMEKSAVNNMLAITAVDVPEILPLVETEPIELILPEALQLQPIELEEDTIIFEEACAWVLELESNPLSDDPNTSFQMENSENMVEMIETTKVIAEPMGKEYFYPVKYEESVRNSVALDIVNRIQQNIPKISLNKAVKIDKGAEVFKIKMNFKNKINALSSPRILEAIHKHLDAPISNELSDRYPSSKDLDILMDFAFLQKEQRNFVQALTFFRQALLLYPDSEVGPFLVMEIGTILKNLGSYDEALEIFTKGRLLPGVIQDTMLEQEFINNIAYLRIVKNILIQNSLEFMPFNSIPKNVFNEIDSQFCEWRNQS